jgi:hypothetical protein
MRQAENWGLMRVITPLAACSSHGRSRLGLARFNKISAEEMSLRTEQNRVGQNSVGLLVAALHRTSSVLANHDVIVESECF